MKNLDDLRGILFDQIEALKKDSSPEAIDKARAINEVSQTIITTARVEVDFYNKVGNLEYGSFIHGVPKSKQVQSLPTGYGTIPEKTGRKM